MEGSFNAHGRNEKQEFLERKPERKRPLGRTSIKLEWISRKWGLSICGRLL
jgi:hypothetical protein